MLHFPLEVYLSCGCRNYSPSYSVRCTKVTLLLCSCFRGGKVREVLSSQTYFEDIFVPVTPSDCIAKTIFVRDVPFEMSNESVEPVFSTVKCSPSSLSVIKGFPAICTGLYTLFMSVNDPVPSTVNVHGFDCRVWYPGVLTIYTEKTGNCEWKIKWCVPCCLQYFRKRGRSFEMIHFSHSGSLPFQLPYLFKIFHARQKRMAENKGNGGEFGNY